MKKLLFSLMFLSGLFLFTSCEEEDTRDNLPKLGENKLEWLQDGAEFVYATAEGDSILMRYTNVKPTSNIFQKDIIRYTAGTDITDPAVLRTLPKDSSFVQPGFNNKKPSLWESNNVRMTPREEIYKFDESFSGKEWRFDYYKIKYQNWAYSTEPGQSSVLNIRTISRNNVPVEIFDATGKIKSVIHCTQIDMVSFFGNSIGEYQNWLKDDLKNRNYPFTTYVSQKYGLIKANDLLGSYLLARSSINIVFPQACWIFTISGTMAGNPVKPRDTQPECGLTEAQAIDRAASWKLTSELTMTNVTVTYRKQ